MISGSPSSSGAPASPSSQQPPLHFARSQTNFFSTSSSLTSILSITIKIAYLDRKTMKNIVESLLLHSLFLVACCWLLVACCWLLVPCCWLLVPCCSGFNKLLTARLCENFWSAESH